MLQGRSREDRRIVEAAMHDEVLVGKGLAHVFEGPGAFLGNQLVRHDDTDLRPLHLVQGQVHADIVDHVADAAAADQQHRGIEKPCHPGVAQAEHRADAAVAGTFDDQEITVLFELCAGVDQLFFELGPGDHTIDDIARIPRLNNHRRHQAEIILKAVDLGDQCGILVDPGIAYQGRFWPDRFDETDSAVFLACQVDQGEAGGGLAAVLAGRRYEDFTCHVRALCD